ncbi:hypothetical protein QSL20_003366 [Salmonella enterica]|nr:hypothetical protein [Salmonella enterica]ELR1630067.1 hypothetical protein [Salmonella enterica]HEF0701398.1 hypothetical protein [Salmonella enterica]
MDTDTRHHPGVLADAIVPLSVISPTASAEMAPTSDAHRVMSLVSSLLLTLRVAGTALFALFIVSCKPTIT